MLIFVLNVDSKISKGIFGYFSRLMYPQTSNCELSMICYGPMGMKRDCQRFFYNLPGQTKVINRRQFHKQFPDLDITYPALVRVVDNKPEVLLQGPDFAYLKTLPELELLVIKTLEKVA